MIAIFAFSGYNIRDEVQCIYSGHDGDAALAAAGKAARTGKFVKFGKLVNPQMIPINIPNAVEAADKSDKAEKAEAIKKDSRNK